MSSQRVLVATCISMLLLCAAAYADDAEDEVDVVAINPTSEAKQLLGLVKAALTSEPLIIRWQDRPDFQTTSFLQTSTEPHSPQAPKRAAVWIDLRHRDAIKIFFRDSEAQRFFVRPIPNQTSDSVVAEQIAQVMAPTLTALADHSQKALSVEEIRSELGDAPAPIAPAAASIGRLASPTRRSKSQELAVEVGFAAHFISAEGASAQGPKLRLSSEWSNRLGDVSVWTSAFRPLSFEGIGAGGEDWAMSVWDWRLGLGFTVAKTEDIAFLVAIAGGADWVSGRPSDTNSDASKLLPALRWEARMNLRLLRWLNMTIAATMDALPPTWLDHPGAAGEGRSMRLATWQPGAALGLELVPAHF